MRRTIEHQPQGSIREKILNFGRRHSGGVRHAAQSHRVCLRRALSPRGLIHIACAMLLCAVLAGAAQAAETIRVGIAQGVTSGRLLGAGIVIKTAKGHELSAANGAKVGFSKGNLVVGGKQISLPATITAKSGLGWGNARYRGSLRIVRAGGGFTVINVLDIESYLRGVVGSEMPRAWNIEALKAQAILARTYALANRGGEYASRGFDVTNSTSSQVYKGIGAESPSTDRAIAETAGEVLTYGGRLAPVYFHSDSGGATADAADVWGKPSPYMRPVAEAAPSESPKAQWVITMTPTQIGRALSSMGQRVGTVRSVVVTRRDAFGRAITMRVKGDRGAAEISAHAFRMAVGPTVLFSTNFAISAEGSRPQYRETTAATNAVLAPTQSVAPRPVQVAVTDVDPLIEMTNNDVFTKDEVYDMLFHPEKRAQYIEIGRARMGHPAPQAEPEPAPVPTQTVSVPSVAVRMPVDTEVSGTVRFEGRGYGHGVGLSQWGAKAMADRGARYREILAHYFPGTSVDKR